MPYEFVKRESPESERVCASFDSVIVELKRTISSTQLTNAIDRKGLDF